MKTKIKNTKETVEIFICSMCGKEFESVEKNFRTGSQTEVYARNNYKLPICNDCLEKLYDKYYIKYKDKELAIKRVCMTFDLYFNKEIVAATISRKRLNVATMAYYIAITKQKQHAGKTFDTYLDEKETETIDNLEFSEEQEKDAKISKKIVNKWGTGYNSDEYRFLENEYGQWKDTIPDTDKINRDIIMTLCLNRLKIKKTNDSKEIDSLVKEYSTFTSMANIQPKQNVKNNLIKNETMGTLIQKWETEDPIPEPDEDFKDVDKIATYIDVFFKGHLSKALNLSNGLSNLYDRYMKKYTVTRPELQDNEIDDSFFEKIFGKNIED